MTPVRNALIFYTAWSCVSQRLVWLCLHCLQWPVLQHQKCLWAASRVATKKVNYQHNVTSYNTLYIIHYTHSTHYTMLPVTIHYTLYTTHYTVHTTQCYHLQYIISTSYSTHYTVHSYATYNNTSPQACNGLMKLFCGFYDILSLASNIYKI